MKTLLIFLLLGASAFAQTEALKYNPTTGAFTRPTSAQVRQMLGTGIPSASNFLRGDGQWMATATVSSVSVVTANGVSGTITNPTTTPAITLTLGAITPITVNGITLSGSGSTLNLNTFSVEFTAGMTLQSVANNNSFTFPATSATIARTDAAQTFGGIQSFAAAISIGPTNTTAGLATYAFGTLHSATASYSGAVGSGASSTILGQQSHAAGRFAVSGDAQVTRTILKTETIGAVTAIMSAQATQFVTTPGKSYACTVTIAARKQGGGAAAHSMWIRKFIITNDLGTVIMDGVVRSLGTTTPTTGDHEGIAGAALPLITANDANDSIRIDAVGVALANIRWVAHIEAIEIGY